MILLTTKRGLDLSLQAKTQLSEEWVRSKFKNSLTCRTTINNVMAITEFITSRPNLEREPVKHSLKKKNHFRQNSKIGKWTLQWLNKFWRLAFNMCFILDHLIFLENFFWTSV